MMQRVALALDGRHDAVLELFAQAGLATARLEPATALDLQPGQEEAEVEGVAVVLVDPWDVPTIVARGGAHWGVVGTDVLAESRAPLVQVLDLKVGPGALVLARPARSEPLSTLAARRRLRVATEYPRLTKAFFARRGAAVETVRLRSGEVAPALGMADGAVFPLGDDKSDVLTDLDLTVEAAVMPISSRLVVSRAARALHGADLSVVCERLRSALPKAGDPSAAV